MAAPVSVPNLPRIAQPGKDEGRLLAWLDRIEGEGTRWQKAREEKGEGYLRAYNGDRELGAKQLRFRANVIRPTIRRRNALLTENKPIFDIPPRVPGVQETSRLLKQIASAAWDHIGMEMALEEMIDMASVFGSSLLGCDWDAKADYGLGQIAAPVIHPHSIIVDPYVMRARDFDKGVYFRIETIRPLWDIQRDYPGRGMLVRPERGLSSVNLDTAGENRGGNLLSRIGISFRDMMRKLQEGPIERATEKHYWVRDPQEREDGQGLVFPRGRHIVRAGSVILEDSESHYFDGLWPAEWFDLHPDIQSPWGRSEVAALTHIQAAVERIGDLFVKNAVLGGNLVVIMDQDAMSPEERNQLTNLEAQIIKKKFTRNIEWRPPAALPPHFLGFITFALRLVDYLVGLNDGQLEGRGRIEMRSGVQLEGLQSAAQTLVRAAARRVEAFLERWGQKFISRIFQFYTTDRILLFLNAGQTQQFTVEAARLRAQFVRFATNRVGSNDAERLKDAIRDEIEQAWQKFAFKIQPMSSLAATKVARAQMLMSLAEAGLVPRKIVLEEAGFDQPEQTMLEAQAEALKFGPMQPPKKTGKHK